MAEIAHAAALNRGQFSRLIKITLATSRYAARDVLVLMLGHKAGLRVTESSRITLADAAARKRGAQTGCSCYRHAQPVASRKT